MVTTRPFIHQKSAILNVSYIPYSTRINSARKCLVLSFGADSKKSSPSKYLWDHVRDHVATTLTLPMTIDLRAAAHRRCSMRSLSSALNELNPHRLRRWV